MEEVSRLESMQGERNDAPGSESPEASRQTATKAGAVKTIPLPGGEEMRFRWCPAGTFTMGSPESEEGRCGDEWQHGVTLTQGFWLAETPVTQGQWKRLMDGETVLDLARKALRDDTLYHCFSDGETTIRDVLGRPRDGNPADICGEVKDDAPVYWVSWTDAVTFCRRLTAAEREAGRLPDGYEYRLPTESEWEYACRAGTTGAYGGTGNLDEMGWCKGNSDGRTHPVKQKKPNAWGLYDMHGNVWEWCADWYDDYPPGSVADPTGPSDGDDGDSRVNRGGSWSDDGMRHCRSAARFGDEPGYRDDDLGFRPALAPSH